MKRLDRKGFTIIELLIATVIFAVILLIMTAAVVQFGRIYYKGVISSRTQEAARSVTEDIGRSIQFGGGAGINTNGFKCFGNRSFSYRTGFAVQPGQNALVAQTVPSCASASAVPLNSGSLPPGATELLGNNMRLIGFDVQESGSQYRIIISVGYGDDDLLAGGECTQSLSAGGQFCAVSRLETTVTKRLR